MSYNHRLNARTDSNEKSIVQALRKIPGVTVITGVNDIYVGHKGLNYYFEIKNPDQVSKKTGRIKESAKKSSQKKLEKEWTGHYHIVSTIDEILEDMGINRK